MNNILLMCGVAVCSHAFAQQKENATDPLPKTRTEHMKYALVQAQNAEPARHIEPFEFTYLNTGRFTNSGTNQVMIRRMLNNYGISLDLQTMKGTSLK